MALTESQFVNHPPNCGVDVWSRIVGMSKQVKRSKHAQ